MNLTQRAASVAASVGSLAWPVVLSLSRGAVLALLRKVQVGSLQITDTDGSITLCGAVDAAAAAAGATPNATEPPPEDGGGGGGGKSVYAPARAALHVHADAFWLRMLFFADMGFAEAYLLGDVSCPDLAAFFRLFLDNRKHLANGITASSALAARLSAVLRGTNTLRNARLNISAHYDISNDMFAAFLSPDMTYSCPIWLPRSDPLSAAESLESAQYRKLDRIIANANIKPTDHLLEIGTGWGSLAIRAVQHTGCRVTSLTLSAEQKSLAEQRISAAGYSDRIRVLLCDYRSLPVPERECDKFDKLISIEMLEAVGAEYLETYFRCVDRLLKTDTGVAVFQCITMPESRYAVYASSDDFIRRYIFPGGHLPTLTQLLEAIRAGSRDRSAGVEPRLIPESVENIGPHYAKTLRLWRQSFMQNFTATIKPALLHEFRKRESGKRMSDQDVELFRRKWEYYFAYCEAGFATKTLGDVIITVGREGCVEMMEDVPL